MELKEFIKQSLTQIAQGVKESQDELTGIGGIVAPNLTRKTQDSYYLDPDNFGSQEVSEIKFKVGVTVNETIGKQGGIGVNSGVLSIGGKVESGNLNQSVNTIEFSIPLVLPPVDIIEIQRKARMESKKL